MNDDSANIREDATGEMRQSSQPGPRKEHAIRRRLSVRAELTLAVLPTLTILIVLAIVEAWSKQRLLFASLASSAFLIYLDPQHGTNRVRTLVLSQMMAALIGALAFSFLGAGYMAAAGAMLIVITLMIVLDVVHPPAVATAMAFAFRSGAESNLLLFALAVALVALLVLTQRFSVWMLTRFAR